MKADIKRPIVAVAVGGIVDILAAYALGFGLLIYSGFRVDVTHLPEAQQDPALMGYMYENTLVHGLGVIFAAFASLLGGYVAARVARRAPLLTGALSAYLSVFLSLAFLGSASDYAPLSDHLIGVPLSFALGALGGAIHHSRVRRASLPNGASASATPTSH